MGKIFVMGDIHGGYLSLKQCLDRCNFDYENDTLIVLGDIVDGWEDSFEVVELLLTIKHLIKIRGNHDQWFVDWLNTGKHPTSWTQGGSGTLTSYCKHLGKECNHNGPIYGSLTNLIPEDIPQSHKEFFLSQDFYYVSSDNKLFVHGGFNRHYHIDDEYANDGESVLIWDRDLWKQALSCGGISSLPDGTDYPERTKLRTKDNFEEIFIGHTTTLMWKYNETFIENLNREKLGDPIDTPMHAAQVWNLDTGGGWGGKLTVMDINSKEYWQSDTLISLYPDQKGRN